MRVYDTPTHWHWEPDMDPFKEEEMIEKYGENWRDHIEFEYFEEDEDEFFNTNTRE